MKSLCSSLCSNFLRKPNHFTSSFALVRNSRGLNFRRNITLQSSWEGDPSFVPNSDAEVAVNNLLYNIPRKRTRQSRHILSVLLLNESGVLARVSGVLAGRGINIDSLVVSETEVPELSRSTIVLKAGDVVQAKKQLEDLVQVWAVVEHYPLDPVIERELLLIKCSVSDQKPDNMNRSDIPYTSPFAPPPTEERLDIMAAHIKRQALVELTELFGGKVVDVAHEHISIELCAKASRIDAFIHLSRPFGIVECSRSGVVAMLRGSLTGFEESAEEEEEEKGTVDVSQLPPG